MFANTNISSVLRLASLVLRCSCGIIRDIKELLLLLILFFGFFFLASFIDAARAVFPAPNLSVGRASPSILRDVPLPEPVKQTSLPWPSSSPSVSPEVRGSVPSTPLLPVVGLGGCKEELLFLGDNTDNLVPAVGGDGVVASGLVLTTGTSVGCGGGVAKYISSRKVYVPETDLAL